MKINQMITLIVIAIGILVIILFFNGKKDDSSTNSQAESNVILDSSKETPASRDIKEFNMIAKKWTYEPNEIVVNIGDQVVLNIKSIDVAHSFTLSEFGVDDFGNHGINSLLEPNKEIQIKFIADSAGEFIFGCDAACGKGHNDMMGKIIVQ